MNGIVYVNPTTMKVSHLEEKGYEAYIPADNAASMDKKAERLAKGLTGSVEASMLMVADLDKWKKLFGAAIVAIFLFVANMSFNGNNSVCSSIISVVWCVANVYFTVKCYVVQTDVKVQFKKHHDEMIEKLKSDL